MAWKTDGEISLTNEDKIRVYDVVAQAFAGNQSQWSERTLTEPVLDLVGSEHDGTLKTGMKQL